MRLTKCIAKNFGSFRDLEFDFEALDLSLIAGDTGAGKSTISDLPTWILFGVTSKGGAADDVKKWGAVEPTSASLSVELPTGGLTVTRTRGKPSQNDLYFTHANDPDNKVRGKDAIETQKMLNQHLGIDAELYNLVGGFTQFSESDAFFTTKPSQRRETLERISDLALPVLLATRSSEARKIVKRDLENAEARANSESGRLVQMRTQLTSNIDAQAAWKAHHASELLQVQARVIEWHNALQRRVLEAQAKSDSWTSEHATRRNALQITCDAFEKDKESKIAKLLHNMEHNAAALEDLPSVESKTVQLSANKIKLERAKQEQQKCRIAVATLETEIRQLNTAYDKFTKNKGTCPECLGPTQNNNAQAFLSTTAAEINHKTREHEVLARALTESEAEIRLATTEIEKETEQVATLQHMIDVFTRQLEVDASMIETTTASVNTYTAQLIRHAETLNPYAELPEQVASQPNPHIAVLNQLETTTNPYSVQVRQVSDQIESQQVTVAQDEARLVQLRHRIVSLSTLYDASFVLRGELLRNNVKALERETNARLDKYFSSEFRCSFSLDDDKLNVEISKGDHVAPFRALSCGQRRMLVVSFFCALRRLALDKAGIELSLFIGDEMLNGLSSDLKVQAFRMFEDMSDEVESVLLIDHDAAFKNMFDKRFDVYLDGDDSRIAKQDAPST